MSDDFRGEAKQVCVIVPTIGRPESLHALLDSLARQTTIPGEIVIADGSDGMDTERIASDRKWSDQGLEVRHLRVSPPNAVRQRVAAIGASAGQYLLLLDDDVELDPGRAGHGVLEQPRQPA